MRIPKREHSLNNRPGLSNKSGPWRKEKEGALEPKRLRTQHPDTLHVLDQTLLQTNHLPRTLRGQLLKFEYDRISDNVKNDYQSY